MSDYISNLLSSDNNKTVGSGKGRLIEEVSPESPRVVEIIEETVKILNNDHYCLKPLLLP